MVSGKATFTSDLGFGVVVVRQVPAQVCSQYGESWLTDATSEGLEKVVDDIRQKHSVVDELLASLDQPDKAIDALWAAGAESRIDAYDRGEIKSISVHEVMTS